MSPQKAVKRNAKPKGKSEVAQKVAAIRSLAPSRIDADAIRAIIGDARVRTLGEVAEMFEVGRNTVQGSWRQNEIPMPGDKGNYPVADILVWLLERDSGRSNRRTAFNAYSANGKHRDEMADIELATAKADLEFRQARALAARGQYVPLVAVQSVIRGVLNLQRDAFLAIPRKWNPRFPINFATDWTQELDNDIRGVLVILAETDTELLLERIKEDDSRSG